MPPWPLTFVILRGEADVWRADAVTGSTLVLRLQRRLKMAGCLREVFAASGSGMVKLQQLLVCVLLCGAFNTDGAKLARQRLDGWPRAIMDVAEGQLAECEGVCVDGAVLARIVAGGGVGVGVENGGGVGGGPG